MAVIDTVVLKMMMAEEIELDSGQYLDGRLVLKKSMKLYPYDSLERLQLFVLLARAEAMMQRRGSLQQR